MKTHYDVIREYSGPILGSDFHLVPSGPVSGMNAELAGPDKCPTCAGYKTVKVQSGFGDVHYPICGDCMGEGTRVEYDRIRAQYKRGLRRMLFSALMAILVIGIILWDVTK